MRRDEFHYDLPPELIARDPAPRRDQSRLLVIERAAGRLAHRRFADLGEHLRPGDLLVVNDAAVVPARLTVHRAGSGGAIELLYLEPLERPPGLRALARPGRRLHPGARLALAGSELGLEVRDRRARTVDLVLPPGLTVDELLARWGEVPLPPYIRQARRDRPAPPERDDRSRYQTVYARTPWAVAAPTAGLHFTPELFERLRLQEVGLAALTLRVGWGTFRPIEADDLDAWQLEAESFQVPPATWQAIGRTRAAGGRVIAVGTTAVRALEAESRSADPGAGEWRRTDLFIRPGYSFAVIDGLITNFHLPCSSLLVLVAAFAGTGPVLAAYREAVARGYRFYSYGDAMLIA